MGGCCSKCCRTAFCRQMRPTSVRCSLGSGATSSESMRPWAIWGWRRWVWQRRPWRAPTTRGCPRPTPRWTGSLLVARSLPAACWRPWRAPRSRGAEAGGGLTCVIGRRNQQHWHRREARVEAHQLDEARAVELRHHQIQHDRVRQASPHEPQRLGAVRGKFDAIARFTQRLGYKLAKRVIIVDDEYALHHLLVIKV